MVGKKQGHAKAYEVGQFLSKTAPFLLIESLLTDQQGTTRRCRVGRNPVSTFAGEGHCATRSSRSGGDGLEPADMAD